MILPDYLIRAAAGNDQEHLFEPWSERTISKTGMSFGLSSAGYDVRVLNLTDVDGNEWPSVGGVYTLAPGDFALGVTVERFSLPADVLGIVHDKSTWIRRGLSVFNTVAENGWNGWLTTELKNVGPKFLRIRTGDPIAQIVLHRLEAPSERAYSGKYQNQANRPVPAILEGV